MNDIFISQDNVQIYEWYHENLTRPVGEARMKELAQVCINP